MLLSAMKAIVLWAFLLGTVRCGEYSDMFECAANSTNIDLKICLNQTGHFQAQVQLEHADRKQDVDALDVDIDQKVTPRCDGSGSVLLVATIPVSPQGNAAVKPQPQKCITEGRAVVKPQPQKRVPQGYRKFLEGHYFKIYPEPVIWLDARDICDNDGAHLAVINSDGEARFMLAMWNITSDWVYIGFHDLYAEGQFVTLYNETLRDAGYNKWYGTYPTGNNIQNCGCIHRTMLLCDSNCVTKRPFFCEMEN